MDEPIAAVGGPLCLLKLLLVAAVAVAQRRRDRLEHQRWRQWADPQEWAFTTRPRVAWSLQVPGEVRLAVSGLVQNRRVTVAE